MSDIGSITNLKNVMTAGLRGDNSGVSVNTTGGTFCNEDVLHLLEQLSSAPTEELIARKDELKSIADRAPTLADQLFGKALELINNVKNLPASLEQMYFNKTGSNLLPHKTPIPAYGT